MINATGNKLTFEIARQSRLARSIERTQTEISGGTRILAPSDDPAASVRISALRRSQADNATWLKNVDLGSSLTFQADGVLRSLNQHFARVQELVVQGASDSLPDDARQTIAAEIQSIAKEVAGLKATQSSLGEPLFSSTSARQIRFANGVTFAPLPAAVEVFAPNGNDVEQQLTAIATAVAGGQRLELDRSLTAAAELVRHGSDVAADIGNAASRLNRLYEGLQLHALTLAEERSHIEDTDLTVAIATLNSQQLTLEAAQAAFARINRRSLIDLLS